MEDQEEAIKVFFNELEKEFHYIVAIENNEILGLVTWLMHGLPKHGLFELDRICILGNSRGKGIGKKTSNWINHVKSVARKEGISYKDALQVASQSYKK